MIHQDFQVSPIDCVILAFAQLMQPVSREELFRGAQGNINMQGIDLKTFVTHFNRLERAGFMWRTEDDKYVTTPAAYPPVELVLDRKERDKLRMLHLNKQRYEFDRLHRQ
jgi:hypothetical protein